MSEVATYGVYVDWNNDGDYGDSNEDVTDDFVSATIARSYSDPLSRVPGVGRCTIVLNNQAQTYSPPLNANALPYRKMKFEMTYGGTTEALFTGYLADIEPDFGQYGTRQARLQCVDDIERLDLTEAAIALLTGIYADDIVSAAVSAVYTPAGTDYQEGINWYATSSPGWRYTDAAMAAEQVKAMQKIRDACLADWGRFFIAKDGDPTYYNRHQMPLDTSTELTLNDTMLGMRYHKPAATVRNAVEVTCYPRAVGEVAEVLGRMEPTSATTIEASDTATYVIRYKDPINAAVTMGGKDIITPVQGTDYLCTMDPEGAVLEAGAVNASLTSYGDRAEITLTNTVARVVYLQWLQIRGYAIRAPEPITVVSEDATSIAAYGKRKLPVDAQLISDPGDAQLLADYLLSYYKDPLNVVEGIEIIANKDATWMAAVRDLELMDKVVITETQTGLSSFAGFISSLQHRINNRYEHRLSFSLEQARTLGTPFRIGISQLNSGHVLIY